MSDPIPADAKPDLSDSIGRFAELVAAGTPTPGGGSVAAYCGVLAASLGRMMCDITIGKPKYAEAEPRLNQIRTELSQLGARLRALIAEDSESFEAVLRAYRMPKETDEQKSERSSQVKIALRRAVDVPLETAQSSFEVLLLLRELADIGTPNALSDVAVGARLAEVAIRGASYNIAVNLDSLPDDGSANETRERVKEMIERSGTIAGEVETKMKV